MTSVQEQLQRLQQSVSDRSDPEVSDEYAEKVYFVESHGLFHVDFYGSPFEESYEEFLQTLCASNIAAHLRSVSLRGPDEGANGTRNWDLTQIIQSEAVFPRLTSFFIELTAPEHHNQTIIGCDYDEDGQIARLIAKTPVLQSLTVPSAPNADFFAGQTGPLTNLRVESGYNHQNFMRNLSQSSRFPGLRLLDFGDFSQRYLENYAEQCTPFDDYRQLFQSQAFATVKKFTLRNSALAPEQLRELHALRKDLQFFTIQTHGEYVR